MAAKQPRTGGRGFRPATVGTACALALLTSPGIAEDALNTPLQPMAIEPHLDIASLPISPASQPFLATPLDLSAFGYVQEEFLVSGTARTYEWAGNGFQIMPITNAAPYTTRILVIRPANPKRFSGNVELETLNASNGYDITTTMATSGRSLMKRGDVWVGVTSKPLTLATLKRFDPVRYARLSWPNPAPVEKRCSQPSIIPTYSFGGPEIMKMALAAGASRPESEDGLLWDIMAQLGAFLKSDARDQILPGFAAPYLFATGYSQSGLIQRTFASAFHNVMRLPGNRPIFDGYLIEVGPAMLRINQCSTDVLPEDARNRLPEIDAPIINIVSEGDMWLGLPTRQPDRIGRRSGLLTYEIAGAPHRPGTPYRGHPGESELARAGIPTQTPKLPFIENDLPRGYISNAALSNLQAWSRKGTAPPIGARLTTEGTTIERDANGNALGGVRNPWIDVPLASYQGAVGLGPMAVVGKKTPFSAERLKQLYGSPEKYLVRFRASVRRATAARWLLADDEAEILARQKSAVEAVAGKPAGDSGGSN